MYVFRKVGRNVYRISNGINKILILGLLKAQKGRKKEIKYQKNTLYKI